MLIVVRHRWWQLSFCREEDYKQGWYYALGISRCGPRFSLNDDPNQKLASHLGAVVDTVVNIKFLFFGKNTVERQRKWSTATKRTGWRGGYIHVTWLPPTLIPKGHGWRSLEKTAGKLSDIGKISWSGDCGGAQSTKRQGHTATQTARCMSWV